MTNIDDLIARLRTVALEVRRTPIRLDTWIPLIQKACDALAEQRDKIARLTAAQSESCTDAKEEAMGCYRAVKAERERDAAMRVIEAAKAMREDLDNYMDVKMCSQTAPAFDAALAKLEQEQGR